LAHTDPIRRIKVVVEIERRRIDREACIGIWRRLKRRRRLGLHRKGREHRNENTSKDNLQNVSHNFILPLETVITIVPKPKELFTATHFSGQNPPGRLLFP
jgi:hypothetical protein